MGLLTAVKPLALRGRYDFIRNCLLPKGACIDALNSLGDTVLIHAAKLEDFSLIELLLDCPGCSALVESKNNKGETVEKLLKLKLESSVRGRRRELCETALRKLLEIKKGFS